MSLPRTNFLPSVVTSPVLHLPVLSAVLELDRARLLYAPGSKTTDAQLRGAGEITDIIAPSLTHTAGVPPALKVFPRARLWGPVGAREKHPELAWHGTFGVDPWPFESELQAIPLAGVPKLNEVAFLHRASKTLYLTDLAFNVPDPKGLLAWLFFGMFGAYRRFAVSKLFLRFAKDGDAFRQSIAMIAALHFENVIVAHGDPVLSDGKAKLLAAFRERNLLA
ncbi:MAG: hypothetical protein ACYCWW_20310 [Deltaproteobacteria bacterium]